MRSWRLWLAGACFGVAACDAIRIPGAEERPADAVSQDTSAPDKESAVIETAPQPAPEPIAETPDAPAARAIGSLAEINAALCGPVLEDAATIAALTGAEPEPAGGFRLEAVNADAANRGDFPGIVKLEPKEDLDTGGIASGHCGATRIAERWLVTAAHCLDGEYDRIELVAGAETLSAPTAVRIEGEAAFCHAGYGGSRGSYANDLALIRLSQDVADELGALVPIASYSETVRPLTPANYTTARMAGWGLTAFSGRLSNELLTAELILASVGPSAISIASRAGAGPCIGDSGGPLYVDEEDGARVLVGVLSVVEANDEGAFCEGLYNGRYTNLQGFRDWIDGVISACTAGQAGCQR
ncbi:MAG: trypsin-like serine protease [Pseudomonadota bacterium]